MHRATGGICVRAMLPQAEKMAVVDSETDDITGEGVRIHPDGPFVATLAGRREPFRYRLRVVSGDIDAVHRFSPVLGELDIHLLVEGNRLASYRSSAPIQFTREPRVSRLCCGRRRRAESARRGRQRLERAGGCLFLLSSVLYWLRAFHIDGIRVDAVASMLYLDCSRRAGDWVPNRFEVNERHVKLHLARSDLTEVPSPRSNFRAALRLPGEFHSTAEP